MHQELTSAVERSRVIDGFPSLHPIMRVKAWLNRRLHRRSRVDVPAKLIARDTIQDVRIVDLSKAGTHLAGVGLKGVSGIEPNDDVLIEFRSGAVFVGLVTWAREDRAGILVLNCRC